MSINNHFCNEVVVTKTASQTLRGVFRQVLRLYETIKAVNAIVQKEALSEEEIIKALSIYDEEKSKNFDRFSSWRDFALHVRQLAFVFGMEVKFDEPLNLVGTS